MAGSLQDRLTSAAARGRTEEVEQLLRAGADVNGVNSLGRTPLQVMMMGSSPVARVLLERGGDPNVADPSTRSTPLHDAARCGFEDTVRLLVQFLADPRALDQSDSRPVDVARDQGHTHVVAFLETL